MAEPIAPEELALLEKLDAFAVGLPRPDGEMIPVAVICADAAATIRELKKRAVPKNWCPQLLKHENGWLEAWWSGRAWKWDDDDDGPVHDVAGADNRDDWQAAIRAAEEGADHAD